MVARGMQPHLPAKGAAVAGGTAVAMTIEEYAAEDFNLSTDHFSTICGIGRI